ncbi:MAG: hypothetical protein OXI96_06070 [Acidimicrobiaceae bacterium]|nr:hypothetical protein [Acidimicrobiaceae bacterium]
MRRGARDGLQGLPVGLNGDPNGAAADLINVWRVISGSLWNTSLVIAHLRHFWLKTWRNPQMMTT